MAEIIKTYLNYPNEIKAMGINNALQDNNYYYRSYTDSVTFGAADESDCKQSIKDIHNYLISLGLVRVDDPSSLTLTNIPDIDIKTPAQNNNISRGDFSKIYGYITYALTDELQTNYPVYLKFTFGYLQIGDNNGRARYGFNIRLNILSNNKSIYQTDISNNIYSGWYSSPQGYLSNMVLKSSYGFYDKNKLYINLFPSKYCKWYGTWTDPRELDMSCYISFYFERNDKFIKFINLSPQRWTRSASDAYVDRANLSFTYLNYRGVTYTSNQNIYVPYVDLLEVGGNPFVTFNTIDIDPATKNIYQNTNVLTYYSNKFTSSGGSVDVTLDNGTIGKYLVYSIGDCVNFANNTKLGMLFRYG